MSCDPQLNGTYSFCVFISSDFNTTSFNRWMETTAVGWRATPKHGNATGFNRWSFTLFYRIADQLRQTGQCCQSIINKLFTSNSNKKFQKNTVFLFFPCVWYYSVVYYLRNTYAKANEELNSNG